MPCYPGKHAQLISPDGLYGSSISAPHGGSASEKGAYGHLYAGGSAVLTTASKGDYPALPRHRRGTPGTVGVDAASPGSAPPRGAGARSAAEAGSRGQRIGSRSQRIMACRLRFWRWLLLLLAIG